MMIKVLAYPKNKIEGSQAIRKLEKRLKELKISYTIEFGEKEKSTRNIAKKLNKSQCDTVICIGGDGTLHGIINGLYGKGIKLGVMPYGHGNDLARYLNIPKNIDAALDIILKGKTKKYFLGEINKIGTDIKEYFFSVAGMGYDAKVIEIVEKQNLKKRFKAFAYTIGAIKAIFTYDPLRIEIIYDNITLQRKAMMVAVGNSTTYGGGMRITPKANPQNNYFNITYLRQLGKLAFLWNLPKVFSGKHIEVKKHIFNFNAREIELNSWPQGKIVADGELLDLLPARIRKSKFQQEIIIP